MYKTHCVCYSLYHMCFHQVALKYVRKDDEEDLQLVSTSSMIYGTVTRDNAEASFAVINYVVA